MEQSAYGFNVTMPVDFENAVAEAIAADFEDEARSRLPQVRHPRRV
jgi:hypothetical protein